MSYLEVRYPDNRKDFYEMLVRQVALYAGDEKNRIAMLANASAVLNQAFRQINWVGFYLVDGKELVLGPFQGKPAVSRIGYGCGVCGTAWKEQKAQVIREVACFPGHIACDCNTHSEIVIPLRRAADSSIWGVLDMDSTQPGRFDDIDREGLERVAGLLERI